MSQSFRPPWLETSEAVEKILQEENVTISITSLRNSRNDCPLVQQLLTTFTSKCLNSPSEWEQDIAKSYLALDVQNIFSKWIEAGRQATMEGSPLAAMLEPKSPTRTVDLNIGASVPQKRRSPDASSDDEGDEAEPEAKQQRYAPVTDEKDFRCPYYILNKNDPAHQECKNKRFPNPRKLKEHIWRFTKPFKCCSCLEGFGREKTKAIHCNERKVKCVPVGINRYVGSLEQQRDEKINQARNTVEMIKIFQDYESLKKAQVLGPQPQHTTVNSNSSNNNNNNTINPSYAVSLPPSDCQWSPATDPPHSPWKTTPLHLYPATPSPTPPFDSNPRSRSNSNPNITYTPNPTHHSPFPIRTFPTRPLPEIPQIIVTGLPTTTEDLSDLFSPQAHTAIHSQPGTPMQPSFNHDIFDDHLHHHHHHHHHHQAMLQGHVDTQREMEMERVMSQEMKRVVSQHRELERVLSEQGARVQQEQVMQVDEDGGVDDDGVTRTVFTPGYGSFPPMRLRLRDNGVVEGLGQ